MAKIRIVPASEIDGRQTLHARHYVDGETCQACGGHAQLKGRKEGREHYRCRACGAEQSHAVGSEAP